MGGASVLLFDIKIALNDSEAEEHFTAFCSQISKEEEEEVFEEELSTVRRLPFRKFRPDLFFTSPQFKCN